MKFHIQICNHDSLVKVLWCQSQALPLCFVLEAMSLGNLLPFLWKVRQVGGAVWFECGQTGVEEAPPHALPASPSASLCISTSCSAWRSTAGGHSSANSCDAVGKRYVCCSSKYGIPQVNTLFWCTSVGCSARLSFACVKSTRSKERLEHDPHALGKPRNQKAKKQPES